MTFSLVGRCAGTGMLGVVVSSSSPAVAARCAHVRAGVGAAASQNVTNPQLGPRLLDLLEAGARAGEAIETVVASEPYAAHRQLAVVDAAGRTAAFSGERTLGTYATREGPGCVAAGNLLRGVAVVEAMVRAFEASAGEHLGTRLVGALAAGLNAGGEEGPVRSAGLLVAREVAWPVADLRVDWHDDPIGELARLWELWAPQLDDYVTRALDPSSAPAFGVPGDPDG
jgi:uncharacterized Ntn-hydrolase superfamily protein